MADHSDRINQLKIDRDAPPPRSQSRLPIIIGLVGGLFPAIRAARLPVAQALREL